MITEKGTTVYQQRMSSKFPLHHFTKSYFKTTNGSDNRSSRGRFDCLSTN